MRKMFADSYRAGRTNYIYYEEMSFLKDYINITKPRAQSETPQVQPNPFNKFTIVVKHAALPPLDKLAEKKLNEVNLLEKECMQIAEKTIRSITKPEEDDCFIQAIRASLQSIDQAIVLNYIPGILQIIKNYQKT